MAQSWMSDGARCRARAADRLAVIAARELEMPRAAIMPASSPVKKNRSQGVKRKTAEVAARTRPSTRSGCWRHTRWATAPPME